MKRLFLGSIVVFFASPGFASPASQSAVDLLLKQTCEKIVVRTESRIAAATAKLAEVEAAKARLITEFVYPEAVFQALNFRSGAPEIFNLLTPETVNVATKYNIAFQQVESAAGIPENMKSEMKQELFRSFGEQLATLITRDLDSTLKGRRTMRNGNRIEDSTMTWGIAYSPSAFEPALSIHKVARFQNYEAPQSSGKKLDPMSAVSATIEMHYDPFANSFSHLATSSTKEDVEPMFVRDSRQLQSGYFFLGDNETRAAKSELQFAISETSYRECKKLE